MNFVEKFPERYRLSTENLLNELSSRLDLDRENHKVFSVLGMILLAHSGDERRLDDSCINHILRVTLAVADFSGDDVDLITLALLHDIVEDYPEYIDDTIDNLWTSVQKGYGNEICDSLQALTNPPDVEQEEKENHHSPVLYHEHIRHTLSDSKAALVKLADFCDNLITMVLAEDRTFIEELQRRYYPVMDIFIETFDSESSIDTDDLKQYFEFIKKSC